MSYEYTCPECGEHFTNKREGVESMMKRVFMIGTAVLMLGIFGGCGENNNRESKTMTKEQFIQKYSRYAPQEQVEAIMGERTDSEGAASFIINAVESGMDKNEFSADLDAYKKSKRR